MAHNYHHLTPGFIISIAGINVQLSCDDVGILRQLASRYDDFKGIHSSVMDVYVKVESQEGAGAFLEAEPKYVDDRIVFESQNYQGDIDIQSGKAWLIFSSNHPVDEIEYFLRVVYAFLVFQEGGLLFHAAGIVRAGMAYLFFGYSGSGKTTVSRLSPDDLVLNDDLVVLMPVQSQWFAYATPFWNPSQVRPTRKNAPVAGLYRLVQDSEVFIQKMGPGQALAELVASSPVLSGAPPYSAELINRCQEISTSVPVFNLHFLPDDSFWQAVAQSQ